MDVNKNKDMELLKSLSNAEGISGFEDDVKGIMEKELKKSCDYTEVDSFGNIIARKGKSGKTKVMLASHMDEVGLLVKHIGKEGFISFIKIGGIDDRLLQNLTVYIKTNKGSIRGIIGSKPPHLQKREEAEKVMKHDELFIDIGAKNDKEAKKLVSVGDPIIFEKNFGKLHNDLYYGKAIDDRIGCYILLKIMKKIPKNIDLDIYAVGTTQEEVGLKGARVSAFKINPDYAFALDTTIAGDTPQLKETESCLKLGKGPAITLTEAGGRGTVTHPKLRTLMINTAKKNKIPYQIDVMEGGMTDGAIIYLTREGIPTGVISVPVRYIHSPTAVFSIKDVDSSIKLAVKTLTNFKL